MALGPEAQAIRLIHAGFWSAREQGRPWVAAHVDLPGEEAALERNQARLWLQEAERLGAEPLWIQAHTVVAGLQEVVRRTGAETVLMGRTPGHWPWNRLGHSLSQELQRRMPSVQVVPLPFGPELDPSPWLPPRGRRMGALLASVMVLGACTGLGALLPEGQPLPAVFLLFLLATAFIAQEWGKAFAAGSIAASAVIFDLVFDSAPGSLVVGNPLLMALFLAILLVGQLAVALADRLERQVRLTRRREALLTALLLLGGNLAEAEDAEAVAQALTTVGGRILGRPVALLVPEGRGFRRLPGGDPVDLDPSLLCAQAHPGGPDLVRRDGAALLPLTSPEGLAGLIEVASPSEAAPVTEADEDLLRAFAVQIALALERVGALAMARRAEMARETERLRSSLLGAVGHDLRTPLAGIHGAASSLLLEPEALPPHARDLLLMIREESDRLAQLLSNLLDLTRLGSGVLRPEKEWVALDELVASALARAEARFGRLDVRLALPADLPLVPADGVLLEQLLLNLLLNARRHAPDSEVEVRAWAEEASLELEVADRGPGIPPDCRDRVFEAFFRLPGRHQDGGVGLGLAICQAIAQVHGGRIWVEDRDGGGARFRLSLPLEGPPPEGPALEEQP